MLDPAVCSRLDEVEVYDNPLTESQQKRLEEYLKLVADLKEKYNLH